MSLKQQMKGARKTYKKHKSKPIILKNSRYSVQIRKRNTRLKTKKAVRKTKRKKRNMKSKK